MLWGEELIDEEGPWNKDEEESVAELGMAVHCHWKAFQRYVTSIVPFLRALISKMVWCHSRSSWIICMCQNVTIIILVLLLMCMFLLHSRILFHTDNWWSTIQRANIHTESIIIPVTGLGEIVLRVSDQLSLRRIIVCPRRLEKLVKEEGKLCPKLITKWDFMLRRIISK